jgi:hypothetical protein
MQLLMLSLLMATGLIGFQNCGGYQSTANNPLYGTDSASTCSGATCSIDLNSVQIRVENTKPISVRRPASGVTPTTCDIYTCFDVSGYCDTGGYSDSIFYIELRGTTAGTFAKKSTGVQCDSTGRFRILVQLPSDFDRQAIYTLDVMMYVKDENGTMYQNPTGQHKQEITVTSSDS